MDYLYWYRHKRQAICAGGLLAMLWWRGACVLAMGRGKGKRSCTAMNKKAFCEFARYIRTQGRKVCDAGRGDRRRERVAENCGGGESRGDEMRGE